MTSKSYVLNDIYLRQFIFGFVPGNKYTAYDGDSIYDILIKTGINDTIYYLSNNQLGCAKYIVKFDNNWQKYLKLIWSAEDDYI